VSPSPFVISNTFLCNLCEQDFIIDLTKPLLCSRTLVVQCGCHKAAPYGRKCISSVGACAYSHALYPFADVVDWIIILKQVLVEYDVKLCVKLNGQCYRVGYKACNFVLSFLYNSVEPDDGTFRPKHVACSEKVIVLQELTVLFDSVFISQWSLQNTTGYHS
jgi:hypothetical protein